jgi:putative NADH-flavin reductase
MQITIFGAGGNVGQQVVTLLLADGHTVVAAVHKHNPFPADSTVRVVHGDIADSAFVRTAIEGSEAVISTLGSWHTHNKNTLTVGMGTIIPIMEATGVKRLITLTGASAFAPADRPTMLDKLTRAGLRLIAPKILADGEAHLRLLSASHLAWTCIRSPAMLPKGTAAYQLKSKLPLAIATISRMAVSQSICDQLTDSSWLRQAPCISRV